MGANQSKSPIPNEKLVIEQLRALEVTDQSDSEYIQVDEKSVAALRGTFKAPWAAVSISEVGQWEQQLLQDPKNRSALPCHCWTRS
jgi:bleomycin hydrolase